MVVGGTVRMRFLDNIRLRALAWLLTFALSGSASAQALQIQAECAQGVMLDERVTPRPYLFSVPLTLGWRFGVPTRPRLGLSVSPTFVNPHWDVGLGARADFEFVSVLEAALAGRFGLDAHYLPIEAKALRVSARGELVVLDDVVHIGFMVGRDFERKRFFLGGSFGVEISAIYRLASGPAGKSLEPPAPPAEPQQPTALDLFVSDVRSRALGVVPRAAKVGGLCWVTKNKASLDQAATPRSLIELLNSNGYVGLGDAIEASLRENRQSASSQALTSAIVMGLYNAAEELRSHGMLVCD